MGEGSLDWVRSVMLRVLNESEEDAESDLKSKNPVGVDATPLLRKADLLSWESKLNAEGEDYERERHEKEERLSFEEADGGSTEKDEDMQDEEPDVVMYAGMFRTAMDWLQDAGEFLKEPSFDYLNMTDEPSENDEGAEESNGTKSDEFSGDDEGNNSVIEGNSNGTED